MGEIGLSWRIGALLVIFQSPFLFGRVNLPQVVNTRVGLRRFAGLDEIRNGNGDHHRHQKNRQADADVTGD